MCLHCSNDLSCILSLGSPCQPSTPGRNDFRQSYGRRDGKRALKQATSGGTLDQDGCMLPEDGVEVGASATTLVHRQWYEALGVGVLERLTVAEVFSKLVELCLF